MNKFFARLVIAIVLIFGGGWFLGGTLNLAALLVPSLVSKVECPAGASAKQEYKQMSFDQPGQKTLTLSCVDASGNPVPTLSDAQIQSNEYKIFYPAGVIVMALIVAAWFIISAVRGGAGAKASPSAT